MNQNVRNLKTLSQINEDKERSTIQRNGSPFWKKERKNMDNVKVKWPAEVEEDVRMLASEAKSLVKLTDTKEPQ